MLDELSRFRFGLLDARPIAYQHRKLITAHTSDHRITEKNASELVGEIHDDAIAREVTEDGSELKAHDSDGGLSGGQRQKLVFFCLAAALRYQLADEDQPIPSYGTIILDEAFNNSDRFFAEDALAIFGAFGFHMVLATPGKLLQTAEDHIGSIVVVTCEDEKRSRLSPVVFENDALAAEGRESR